MKNEDRKREDWSAAALEVGVDPNEPDDARFWGELDRARAIIDSFRYHLPSGEQIDRIAEVRQACIACARTILRCSPVGADQTAALRKLHEAMMTTNKAIVCEVKHAG